MSEERLVPKLRFVEFKDGWKSKTLGEISEIYGRIGFRGYTVKDLVSEGEGALTLGGKHINSNNRLDLSEPDYLSWDKYEESPEIKVSKGDIITSQRGTLGRSAYIFNDIGKATINPSMVLLKKFKEDGIFLYYTLIHQNFIKEVYRRSSSTAVPMISQSELKKININFPSLNEQKKIANFLSNVDEKLELLNQKLNQTTQFKKYLMQNIFSQKLRFNEEEIWKTVEVSSVVSEYKEKAGDNDYPVLSSTLSGIFLQSDYFDKNVNSSDTQNYKVVPKGYFTYRSMSDTGIFRFNIQNIIEKGIISPAYPVFTTRNINKCFLEEYLNNSPNIKRQILTLKEGGTRYALGFNKFKKLKIELPSSNEQNKIADCLKTMNTKIDNANNELKYLIEFKKGLIQQMFV